jgi:hypothetical protein
MFGCIRHIQGVYTNVVKMYSNNRVLQQPNISSMQVASFSSYICVFEMKTAKIITCDCRTTILLLYVLTTLV